MKIRVTVKPNAHKTEVVFVRDGCFRVSVVEPATQNKANVAVVKALAQHFNVAKGLVKITRGKTTKSKLIEIDVEPLLFDQ